ncbi:hypothetical protein B0J18DRAFT_414775 [Chaetomium sp. MPI-SDFR-AT-0129]|nr:hypothetical protein B0J18DRAFT_414775 [Chaetomium sp. MPI-SDFR-AT-0129]
MPRSSSVDSNRSFHTVSSRSFHSDSSGSFYTAYSQDSYAGKLKPGKDDLFKKMFGEVEVMGVPIQQERKIQSSRAKKGHPGDVERRHWTPEMKMQHSSYKRRGDEFVEAKEAQRASVELAREARDEPVEVRRVLCERVVMEDERWVATAFVAASTRLGFMRQYPDAFCTRSTTNHVKQVESCLDSAKKAAWQLHKHRTRKIMVPSQLSNLARGPKGPRPRGQKEKADTKLPNSHVGMAHMDRMAAMKARKE